VYPERELLRDRDYSIKKLGLSQEQFAEIMAAPNKNFLDYRTSREFFEKAKKIVNAGRRSIG
jgi:hypothetical protein